MTSESKRVFIQHSSNQFFQHWIVGDRYRDRLLAGELSWYKTWYEVFWLVGGAELCQAVDYTDIRN